MKYLYSVIITFLSCSAPAPAPDVSVFIGKWKGDNVELELRDDGTFSAKGGYNARLLVDCTTDIFSVSHDTIIYNISGTWVYEDYLNYGEKDIRLESSDKGCSSPLFIDKKYFASFRHIYPYMLYLILGDPDNADWIRLEKVVE